MSDFRNNDPLGREPVNNQTVRNDSGWAWIGALVVIIAVAAIIFAFGHRADNGASPRVANNTSPAVTHMAPPLGAPATPAPQNGTHL
ncbi:MAG: hypothetical protein ACRECV_18625 [Xanthobacteraceae bacterium]